MATPVKKSPRKEFQIEKPAIGKGSYGKVYKATWTRHNTEKSVAVKIFPLDVSHSRSAFEAESRMSVLLNGNPFCVTIHKAYISNNKGYIVMDLFSGDLMDIQDSLEYNESKSCKLFYKICNAVRLLHAKRVVHLDIKPDNILVDDDGEPFLADFGSSNVIPLGGRYTKPVGTDEFAAPEVLSGEAYSPFPADLWSLGVLLYTMLTGKYPRIKKGEYRTNSKLSDECNSVLSSLLQPNPKLRIDIRRLLKHEWFDINGCVPPIDLNDMPKALKPSRKSPKSPRALLARLKGPSKTAVQPPTED